MSFRCLLTLSLFLAIALLALAPIRDYDIWYHLKAGEWIFVHLRLPAHDPFSFTAQNHPWILHEWLAQLSFFLVWRGLSFPGLILFKTFLVLATFYFVYQRCLDFKTHPTYTAIFVFLAALLSAGSFTERPHLFSFLLTSFTLYLLPRLTHPSVYFFLGFFWVNFHSSFFLLLILLCAQKLLEEKYFPGKALLAALAGTAVNPYSVKIWLYPFTVAFNPAHTETIQEWLSPDFHLPQMWLLELFLALPVLFAFFRKICHAYFLFLYFFFAHSALQSVRHAPLFALAVAPYLAHYCSHIFPRAPLIKKTPLHFLFLALYVPLLVTSLPRGKSHKNYIQVKEFPWQGVAYLKNNHLPGHLLTSYEWGGYCIFYLYPQYQVFIDGRMDIYARKIMPDYLKIARTDKGFEKLLLRYQVGTVLFPRQSLLVRELKELGWKVKHEDAVATVLVPPSLPAPFAFTQTFSQEALFPQRDNLQEGRGEQAPREKG